MRDTLLTAFTASFINDPLFKYRGVGPEDIVGTILMELVIGRQCAKSKASLNMYTMWHDALTYGLGVVAIGWEREYGLRTIRYDNPLESFGLGGTEPPVDQQEEVLKFEGNTLKNISPYDYLPDPNVPVQEVQNGEFVAWLEQDNYTNLLRTERDNPDAMFNARYANKLGAGESQLRRVTKDVSGIDLSGLIPSSSLRDNSETRPLDILRIVIDLIPKEHGLGESEYPEKWQFGIAGDSLIIEARPLGYDHGMFPVAVCAPDYDGYEVAPLGRMEIAYGVQEGTDWFVNSHIHSVRQNQLLRLVYDPSMVMIDDVRKGGNIRVTPEYYGRAEALDKGVKQLNLYDPTTGHVGDAYTMMDFGARTVGASDSAQGVMQTKGERRSATEARGAGFGGISRIEKLTRMASIMAHHDIALQMAANTAQLQDEDTYVNIVGEHQQRLLEEYGVVQDQRVPVSPSELNVDYDVQVMDGSVPNPATADIWVQALGIIGNNPELAQKMDIPRIFTHVMRVLGVKDAHAFVRNGGEVGVNVANQAEIDAGVNSGQLEAV
jgi:hypothetical protein